MRYTMSRVTPAAWATSSMDVPSNPRSRNAAAAASISWARRSARGSRVDASTLTSCIHPCLHQAVKFGVFYEHQLGRPWDDSAEHRLLHDALEQVELADSLGFEYVWEVEHHFLEEYSHSSAPEVFLAACSQRTSRIRLGHGVVLTAPAFNHPARVAERIAMLDLLSDGRVEFGSGESSSEAELGGFQLDPARKRDAWLEGLETALRCMVEVPFTGVDGEFVQMPPRNVVPKPRQKPHPPLWVACSRRETILLAASKGMGALTFAFIDPEEARTWVREYEQTLATCVPVGWTVNPQVACVSPMMMHHDEDEAIRRGVEGANFFGYSLGHYYVFGSHRPGRTDVWSEYTERRAVQGFDPEAVAQAVKSRAPRGQGRRRGHHRPAGLHRHAGPGPRVPAPLRGGRRRPGHLRPAGGPQPPRAHHGVARGVRPGGAARVRRAGRTGGRGQGGPPGAGDRRRAGAARRRPAAGWSEYEFPALPRQWADASGSEEMREWLDRFADDRAAGKPPTTAGITG